MHLAWLESFIIRITDQWVSWVQFWSQSHCLSLYVPILKKDCMWLCKLVSLYRHRSLYHIWLCVCVCARVNISWTTEFLTDFKLLSDGVVIHFWLRLGVRFRVGKHTIWSLLYTVYVLHFVEIRMIIRCFLFSRRFWWYLSYWHSSYFILHFSISNQTIGLDA